MHSGQRRFNKENVLRALDDEMTKLEDRYRWQRNCIGTAELERPNVSIQKAADIGRYIVLCDLMDEFAS